MRYEGNIFRPPSEADSLILQATVGCSHNRCTFCAMYQDVRFRVRSMDEMAEDILMARNLYGPRVRRIFLADGDPLIMKTAQLQELLRRLREAFPSLQRVGTYATPQSLLRKSPQELEALKALKLVTLYLGVESGSAEVLAHLQKGVTPEEMVTAGQRAVNAGLRLSTMIILGAGGTQLARQHARESAVVLNRIRPRFISTLSLMVIAGTPLHEEMLAGRFHPPSPRQTLEELRDFVAALDVKSAVFRSNHISNLLPLAGTLMKDKPALMQQLETALAGPIPEEFGPQRY